MKVEPYQVVVVAIASVMIFQGIKNFVKRESGQTFLKLAVRLTVWGGMALIAIYPDSTSTVAKVMGIKENVNAAILIGFLLIFIIIFKLLSAIEKIEQNISELTRKDALEGLEKKIETSREDDHSA